MLARSCTARAGRISRCISICRRARRARARDRAPDRIEHESRCLLRARPEPLHRARAQAEPERFAVIDASGPRHEVQADVHRALELFLARRRLRERRPERGVPPAEALLSARLLAIAKRGASATRCCCCGPAGGASAGLARRLARAAARPAARTPRRSCPARKPPTRTSSRTLTRGSSPASRAGRPGRLPQIGSSRSEASLRRAAHGVSGAARRSSSAPRS